MCIIYMVYIWSAERNPFQNLATHRQRTKHLYARKEQ